MQRAQAARTLRLRRSGASAAASMPSSPPHAASTPTAPLPHSTPSTHTRACAHVYKWNSVAAWRWMHACASPAGTRNCLPLPLPRGSASHDDARHTRIEDHAPPPQKNEETKSGPLPRPILAPAAALLSRSRALALRAAPRLTSSGPADARRGGACNTAPSQVAAGPDGAR
eukprot:355781-Chlamydomonas_euryale.AAC.1